MIAIANWKVCGLADPKEAPQPVPITKLEYYWLLRKVGGPGLQFWAYFYESGKRGLYAFTSQEAALEYLGATELAGFEPICYARQTLSQGGFKKIAQYLIIDHPGTAKEGEKVRVVELSG